jgi:hypothetical protein
MEIGMKILLWKFDTTSAPINHIRKIEKRAAAQY